MSPREKIKALRKEIERLKFDYATTLPQQVNLKARIQGRMEEIRHEIESLTANAGPTVSIIAQMEPPSVCFRVANGAQIWTYQSWGRAARKSFAEFGFVKLNTETYWR